jgi:acyl-CoA thioester hydrolase
MAKPVFELTFTAAPEHIDELGHVNNAVWVQWIQQVAVAHWDSAATPAHRNAYFWVVVRHEIDYVRAAHAGDRITARTWVGEAPQGARFDRLVEFTGADGKVCVRAKTQWAIIDKASGRPIRVRPEVVAPFLTAR